MDVVRIDRELHRLSLWISGHRWGLSLEREQYEELLREDVGNFVAELRPLASILDATFAMFIPYNSLKEDWDRTSTTLCAEAIRRPMQRYLASAAFGIPGVTSEVFALTHSPHIILSFTMGAGFAAGCRLGSCRGLCIIDCILPTEWGDTARRILGLGVDPTPLKSQVLDKSRDCLPVVRFRPYATLVQKNRISSLCGQLRERLPMTNAQRETFRQLRSRIMSPCPTPDCPHGGHRHQPFLKGPERDKRISGKSLDLTLFAIAAFLCDTADAGVDTPILTYYLDSTQIKASTEGDDGKARRDGGNFLLLLPRTICNPDIHERVYRLASLVAAKAGNVQRIAFEEQVRKDASVRAEAEERERQEASKIAAVAAFNHQIGHVIAGKSGVPPLYTFPDQILALQKQLPSPLLQDAAFRAAQIAYAAILPDVFRNTVLAPEPANQNSTLWTPTLPVRDLLHVELWNKMLEPLVRRTFPVWHPRFLRSHCVPKVRWRISATCYVPGCELIRAMLFELLWNAFRRGSFAADKQPSVSCSAAEYGDLVRISISNPCQLNTSPDRPEHVDSLVNSLRHWTAARGHDAFSPNVFVIANRWVSELTLPKDLPL